MVFTVGYDNIRSSGTKIDCTLEILNCFVFVFFFWLDFLSQSCQDGSS